MVLKVNLTIPQIELKIQLYIEIGSEIRVKATIQFLNYYFCQIPVVEKSNKGSGNKKLLNEYKLFILS